MKVLLVTNTGNDIDKRGHNDGIRDTWLRQWKPDHRFVYGNQRGEPRDEGEIVVEDDTEDSYHSAARRTRGAAQYMLDNGYDFMFKTDVDTYVSVPRLFATPFWDHDYYGYIVDGSYYCSGGSGFWISRKGAHALAAALPQNGYEDVWVGETLVKAGIHAAHDKSFVAVDQHGPPFKWDNPAAWENVTTTHLGRGTGHYNPEWMRECHRKYTEFFP